MTDEQSRAFTQVRRLAAPARFRVVADAEGFPVIRGKLGDIEGFHAEGTQLAAYTAGNRARLGRLLSLPGIVRHQVGDHEVRVLFPVAMLPNVARVIRARTRRRVSPNILERLRRRPEGAGSGGSGATIAGSPEVQVEVPHPRASQAGTPGVAVPVIQAGGKGR